MESLWPEDIAVVETKAPVTILKEQASILGNETKGTVEGEVAHVLDSSEELPFSYAFHIKAPALGDYRYRLFTIAHDVSMYPLLVRPDETTLAELKARKALKEFSVDPKGIDVGNERDFVRVLSLLFASRRTKQVVRAILAQSGLSPAAA